MRVKPRFCQGDVPKKKKKSSIRDSRDSKFCWSASCTVGNIMSHLQKLIQNRWDLSAKPKTIKLPKANKEENLYDLG